MSIGDQVSDQIGRVVIWEAGLYSYRPRRHRAAAFDDSADISSAFRGTVSKVSIERDHYDYEKFGPVFPLNGMSSDLIKRQTGFGVRVLRALWANESHACHAYTNPCCTYPATPGCFMSRGIRSK